MALKGRDLAIGFGPEGKGGVQLWDLATEAVQMELSDQMETNDLSFSGEGDRLATAKGCWKIRKASGIIRFRSPFESVPGKRSWVANASPMFYGVRHIRLGWIEPDPGL